MDQYSRVPFYDSYRHFNAAAASWQLQRPEEALVHLLRGVTRDTETMDALIRAQRSKAVLRGEEYWREFADLWPEEARRFAANICADKLVRFSLTKMFHRGVLVRELVSAHSRALWRSASQRSRPRDGRTRFAILLEKARECLISRPQTSPSCSTASAS